MAEMTYTRLNEPLGCLGVESEPTIVWTFQMLEFAPLSPKNAGITFRVDDCSCITGIKMFDYR